MHQVRILVFEQNVSSAFKLLPAVTSPAIRDYNQPWDLNTTLLGHPMATHHHRSNPRWAGRLPTGCQAKSHSAPLFHWPIDTPKYPVNYSGYRTPQTSLPHCVIYTHFAAILMKLIASSNLVKGCNRILYKVKNTALRVLMRHSYTVHSCMCVLNLLSWIAWPCFSLFDQ